MTKMKYLLLGLLSIVVIAGVIMGDRYSERPETILKQFIDAVNNQNYDVAYDLLHKDDKLQGKDRQSLIHYMSNYFENYELEKIEQDKVIEGTQDLERLQEQVYYPVTYYFKDRQINAGINLVRDDKWYVQFPFKWSDIEVKAPLGSEVYFNKKLLSESSQEVFRIEELLPGKYSVEMKFANDAYPIYQEMITIPKHKVVQVPYETADVMVETLPEVDVTLSGVTKNSGDGQVIFEDVLIGKYDLILEDSTGYYSSYKKEVEITEDTSVSVNKLELTEKGIKNIAHYLDGFYKDYLKGIETQDAKVLHAYTLNPEWIKTYEEWFVKNKQPKNIDFMNKVTSINQGDGSLIDVQVQEETVFTNKDTTYKVFLSSTIVLKKVGQTYQIENKVIDQSIVSYKDEEGMWVAY